MRSKLIKISLAATAFAATTYGAFLIFNIYRSAHQTLAETRARHEEQKNVSFEKRILTPHLTDKVQILQNTNYTRDIVQYKNAYYAATSGGLVRISEDGNREKHFTVLDGLPESDLTCLAVYQNKLFIGTRTKNLIAFDGANFENYIWTDRAAQSVTAFLEANDKLLIGTLAGGLLEFDGENFTEIKATDKKKISSITCLFEKNNALYVGTFNDGLWINKSGIWSHFTVAEGLPSNRVVGVASNETNLYAATDLGLAVLEEKNFRTVAQIAPLSSLTFSGDKVFLAKDDGEIFIFGKSLKKLISREDLQNARLLTDKENLMLVSNQGVFKIDGAKLASSGGQNAQENLTDNFISALAFDETTQNLWIGTFRRGIDVFAVSGRKLAHLEAENLREINFLQSLNGKISAAASSGLINFDKNFKATFITKNEGLPSISVTHFFGSWTATAKGLSFADGKGKTRIISIVQGLPNNSVYTTLEADKKVYVGTLGGLAEIESTRVVRTFKDSNSNLKTNWVTALIQMNDRIFIGTYGGGIFELLPSGEIRSFETEIGKFVVNPNAFYSDGVRLYAGTLTGVKILDLRSQAWHTIKNILPAETVMAITGDDKNVYFGTTNGIARVEKSYFETGEKE